MASSSNPKRHKNKSVKSHSNHKPREYAKVEGRRLLQDENLYELVFNEIGFVGCTYFEHRKRQRHSIMYIIPCQFTLKSSTLKKIFNGEDVDLPKGSIIHDCHKICSNCLENFKHDGKRCKICPNHVDLDYKIFCKPMLNLWLCQGFVIQNLLDFNAIIEGCKNFIAKKKNNSLLGLIVQCKVEVSCALYDSTPHGLNLPTRITMHITYSNIPNQNNLISHN